MRRLIRILGIDPGLRRTGWGLIESDGNRLVYVACGSVETNDRAELCDGDCDENDDDRQDDQQLHYGFAALAPGDEVFHDIGRNS